MVFKIPVILLIQTDRSLSGLTTVITPTKNPEAITPKHTVKVIVSTMISPVLRWFRGTIGM
jgi:hypothetical protein